MESENRFEDLVGEYTALLLKLLESKAKKECRSYGFEYEFLSETQLDLNDMRRLYSFLPKCGFDVHEGYFLHASGTRITFEPGGQIEYQSIPFCPEDKDIFSDTLVLIQDTNDKISDELNINYLATGYISGRKDAPLCLEGDRYKSLHSRMPLVGSRGLEMMKGTASIHMHVGIRHISELVPLFATLCEASISNDFGMQAERRDIWNNTDPSRCDFYCQRVHRDFGPQQLLSELVRFTLNAEDLEQGIVFYRMNNIDFDSFMYHLTTIFTDVRLNVKGPTFELRTLDSLPIPDFEQKWLRFIEILEDI